MFDEVIDKFIHGSNTDYVGSCGLVPRRARVQRREHRHALSALKAAPGRVERAGQPLHPMEQLHRAGYGRGMGWSWSQVGMLGYVGFQIGLIGVGVVMFMTLWKSLKAKTG